MGRNIHPDYLYLVKKDLSWKQISDETEKINTRNFLCFVKTVFVYNNGDYTYSEHYILDKNMRPLLLSFGVIKSGHFFKESLANFHQASITVNISDVSDHSRSFLLSHSNGLGSWYSDINGQGINSIIDALKIMIQLDELKTWETFDIVYSVKKRIALNLLRNKISTISDIKKIVELSNYHTNLIWEEYLKK
jgi:hypothetical protein